MCLHQLRLICGVATSCVQGSRQSQGVQACCDVHVSDRLSHAAYMYVDLPGRLPHLRSGYSHRHGCCTCGCGCDRAWFQGRLCNSTQCLQAATGQEINGKCRTDAKENSRDISSQRVHYSRRGRASSQWHERAEGENRCLLTAGTNLGVGGYILGSQCTQSECAGSVSDVL